MLRKILRTALAGLIMVTTLSAITTTPAQAAPAYRHFKNLYSNRCMSVQGGATGNGAQVVEWGCNTSLEQKWYWSGQNIVNAKSGKCLSSNSFDNPIIWDCYDWEAPEQDWWLSSLAPEAGKRVVNYKNGKKLGVGLSGPSRLDLFDLRWENAPALTIWSIYAVN
ncbi:RICIN domain-containing protein [Streptosporangium subroseum]|uniref:RICIN domain-containing protein n=1 Tax=Streptosporangium subroseum TaxID=106412 RepID=UPI003084A5D2|nr:RICIN domain-containing protein [Streptosporangium subroseum]